jgi:putative membrane protein
MKATKTSVTVLCGAAAALFALGATAEDVDDSNFLMEALQTDLAEIKMGELAAQRGTSMGVKEYGEKLQADHSKALQDTSALAKELGVTIPTEPTEEAQEHHAAISKLSGAEFDAAFVSQMIMGHEKAIAKFTEQTHANPNKEIAALATKRLPTLREHLAIAESLQATAGSHGTHPTSGNQRPPAH